MCIRDRASFLELFDGNDEMAAKIDAKIAEKMGYESCFAVSGQTYPRKPVSYTHLDVYKRQAMYCSKSSAMGIS